LGQFRPGLRRSYGLAGLECLSGIPGSVGGTPVQNVGAYGQEVSETIVSVRCFDRESSEIVELSNAECGFSYRKSIFNSTHKDKYTVLSVNYALRIDGQPKLAYKELAEHFGDRQATLSEVRQAVLKIRRAKSMVIDPDDPNSRSAGSFFKNPIVTADAFESIVQSHIGSVPSFPAGDGLVKVPAAWLIENAGFHKGFRQGRAGISANHSLAIINCGGASARDILDLMSEIQNSVRARFGIDLVPEPVFVGFDG
jgi:UDP-N-acetylmuramate dehydrogenase